MSEIPIRQYFNIEDDEEYKNALKTSISKDKAGLLVHKIVNKQKQENIINDLDKFTIEELEQIYRNKHKTKFTNPYTFGVNTKEDSILTEIREEVYQLLLLKKRGEATELLSKFIKQHRAIKSIFIDKEEEIYFYNEGIYVPNGVSEIKRIVRLVLREVHNNSLSNEVVNKIFLDTLIEQEEFFDQQKNFPHIIPVKNGLLDLLDKKLYPFSSDKYFFSKLSVSYNPANTNSKAKEFITSILHNEENVKTIQETLGYCLLRDYRFEKAFMWTGDGRNGKGKLINLVQTLFGKNNTFNASLEDMEEDPFLVGNLNNKFVNFSSDLNETVLNNSGLFRSLTGRDEIMAPRKFLNPISFVNHAKMIFATNGLPEPRKVTDAFWLRWVVVKFPFIFLPQKELDALENNGELTSFHRLQNPEIIADVTSQESLEGFLLWILEGLERLLKKKDFTFSKNFQELKDDWLRESNSLIAFVNDNIRVDYDSSITKASFKREYASYCVRHKIKSIGDRAINNYLTKELGAFDDREYVMIEGVGSKQVRIWKGIRLRLEKEVEDQEVL